MGRVRRGGAARAGRGAGAVGCPGPYHAASPVGPEGGEAAAPSTHLYYPLHTPCERCAVCVHVSLLKKRAEQTCRDIPRFVCGVLSTHTVFPLSRVVGAQTSRSPGRRGHIEVRSRLSALRAASRRPELRDTALYRSSARHERKERSSNTQQPTTTCCRCCRRHRTLSQWVELADELDSAQNTRSSA